MSETPNRHFTPQELAGFDGSDGKPTYVAYKGVVYDISNSKLWKAGKHMNRHHAGADMGLELSTAPHAATVLERFPKVGVLDAPVLAPEPVGPRVPAWLAKYMTRFPMLKRHPHPMTVHFPIAFCVAAPVCLVLSLFSNWSGFDAALLFLLAVAALFTPIAIVTGLFTWWLNYAAARIRPVVIKLIATPLLLAAVIWALVWRLQVPDVMAHPMSHLGFTILVLALFPLVSIIGWCGAALTFPPHDDE